MKIVVQGQGPVTLTQAEFVASGGEGSVYAKGMTAYKLYDDPKRMIPLGKISELGRISDPDVIKPEVVVMDPKANTPIGYTMRFVRDTMPLCQVFTRAFREREGLDHAKMLGLVRSLQARVTAVHQGGALVVDLNEMNFLVDKAFSSILAIDVDSYQTKSYPASALMPSVRDWTVGSRFTELSDWFSFAIVSFQMYVGIHPYKGRHACLHGFEPRMRAHASVLGSDVTVPAVVYPFTVIPSAYLAWFRAVLQDGKRLPPPTDLTASVSPVVTVPRPTLSSQTLEITELCRFEDCAGLETIAGFAESFGTTVIWTNKDVYVDKQPMRLTASEVASLRAVGFSPSMNVPVLAFDQGGRLGLWNCRSRTPVELDIQADRILEYGGRIYVKSGATIVEVILSDKSGRILPSARVVANVLEHATQFFSGVAVQNLLGSVYASTFPDGGCHQQIRLKELDGLRIVDAKHDRNVMMVLISLPSGQYDRLTFILDGSEPGRLVDRAIDITPSGLNFIVLDTGVCVQITEEDHLELWSVRNRQAMKKAGAVGNDLRLCHHAGRVAAIRGSQLLSLRMR